jgi:hypothetical protein
VSEIAEASESEAEGCAGQAGAGDVDTVPGSGALRGAVAVAPEGAGAEGVIAGGTIPVAEASD